MNKQGKARLTDAQLDAKKKFPLRLTRDGLPEYGLKVHGLRLGKGYYAAAAVRGDGPEYFKIGKQVLYDQTHFDDWAADRLGLPAASATEHLRNHELLVGQ